MLIIAIVIISNCCRVFLSTILSTDTIVILLEQKNINTNNFLKIIELYLKEFEKLENFQDTLLLGMLDEKLEYFVNNSENTTQ